MATAGKAILGRAAIESPEPVPVRVGRHLYERVYVSGPLLDAAGRRCAFRVDHVRRRIEIYVGVPLADRPAVEATAISHAWQRATVAIIAPRWGQD